MFIHPEFNPVAFQLGPLAVHWYGLMYLVGFCMFIILGRWRIKRGFSPNLCAEDLDRLLFYGVLGVVIGGRLGYVLFYRPHFYFAYPIEMIKFWSGGIAGMSFHGGFLGVVVALWLLSKKIHRTFLQITDFVAPLTPLGLAAGRLGNFINGELWGRVTASDEPWAMVFPQAQDGLPRHPSQLYEFALEGVLLFVVLWIYSSRPRKTGQISAVFLIGYGSFRFIAEFAREPDNFLGILALHLSMGQWLSIPMVLVGLCLFRASSCRNGLLR